MTPVAAPELSQQPPTMAGAAPSSSATMLHSAPICTISIGSLTPSTRCFGRSPRATPCQKNTERPIPNPARKTVPAASAPWSSPAFCRAGSPARSPRSALTWACSSTRASVLKARARCGALELRVRSMSSASVYPAWELSAPWWWRPSLTSGLPSGAFALSPESVRRQMRPSKSNRNSWITFPAGSGGRLSSVMTASMSGAPTGIVHCSFCISARSKQPPDRARSASSVLAAGVSSPSAACSSTPTAAKAGSLDLASASPVEGFTGAFFSAGLSFATSSSLMVSR
mmetsp:Transcript_115959/g.369948  ORF Transcript_115959/g.369948 Transcript_115959/m.369948 type:complete len:285 (+) Transcript_115959:985-1839(+)